jgi:hypothetical protein
MEERMNITISAETRKALSQIKQLKAELQTLSEKSSIGGLDTMSVKELQETLKYFQSYGSKGFEKQIKDLQKAIELQQKISGLSSPQQGGGGININKGLIAQIAGGVFAVRSIYLLVRKIAGQNENLTKAVDYLMQTIGALLKPLLDFIAKLIMAVAKVLGSFFKVQVKTGKTTNKILSKQLASFDEINNLTREKGSSVGGSGWEKVSNTIKSETKPLLEQFQEVADATNRKLPPYIQKWAETGDYLYYTFLPELKEKLSKWWNEGFGWSSKLKDGLESVKNSILGNNSNKILASIEKNIIGKQNESIRAIKQINNRAVRLDVNMDIKPNVSGGGSVKFSQIAHLSTGGLINEGLFVAGEKGPELVGTMGKQSVVANNMQIVEGIKQGVKEALAESSQAINISVDGETLARVVSKNIQRNKRIMGVG